MTLYRCQIVASDGSRDWRAIEAPTEQAASARLLAEGVTPVDIRSGAVTLIERLRQPIRFGRRLGIGEQALLLTQLAMLVRSGLPVDRSLDLLREQAAKARQRDALSQMLGQVRSGFTLAKALENQQIFPAYVTGIIHAAERTGQLGKALTSVAERITAASATRRQLVTALTYPAAVLAATFVALILVLTIVVPQFEPVFAGQEARLPALTRAVLRLSYLIQNFGVLLMGAIAALAFLLWRLPHTPQFAALVERHGRRIPGMTLRNQYLAAQFTGLLATLFDNGIPVVRALPMTAIAIGSLRWRRHILAAETHVRSGFSFSRALAREEFVPLAVVRLLEVGERTGKLAETSQRASEIIADTVKNRIERIVSLANPIAIITLGGIVALLVAGVMLGIFAIGDFVD